MTFATTTVPADLPTLPTWLMVLVMSVNCMFGASLARSRNVPVFGTLLAGVLVGLGGGIFRDMMLGLEPAAIAEWYYLPSGILLAVVGAFAYDFMGRHGTVFVLLNGVVLGTLVTIGAEKALMYDAPPVSAIFLGIITASFGGLLADNIAGERATIAKQAHWVGAALTVGTTAFVLAQLVLPFGVAVGIGIVATAFLRFTSQVRDWPSPSWPGELRNAA